MYFVDWLQQTDWRVSPSYYQVYVRALADTSFDDPVAPSATKKPSNQRLCIVYFCGFKNGKEIDPD